MSGFDCFKILGLMLILISCMPVMICFLYCSMICGVGGVSVKNRWSMLLIVMMSWMFWCHV